MLSGVVTNRYAQGLFLVTQSHGVTSAVNQGLQLLATTFAEHPEYKSIIDNPVINAKQKYEAVDNVFGENLDPLVKRFLRVLFERSRGEYVSAIAGRFGQLADEAEGKLTVTVQTARALGEEEAKQLDAQLSEALHKEIHAQLEVNPELLAGYQVRVGNRVLDATLRGALNQFSDKLLASSAER